MPAKSYKKETQKEISGGAPMNKNRMAGIKRWDSKAARTKINKGDYADFLKRFNFVHGEFPLASFPKERQWFPFYIGNGDLGMLLDPLGTNTLSFKFEYAQNGWGNNAWPILSANDAFLHRDPYQDCKKDVWTGKPGKNSPVRGLKVQVDAGPVFEESDGLYERISGYHQEMELWDGICRTRFLYDKGLEIQVDSWLSWSDTRVGAIRYSIINKSHDSREISLHNRLVCKYYGADIVFRETQGFQYAEVPTQVCKIGLAYACVGERNNKYPSEEKIMLGKGEKAERIFYFSLASDAVKGVLPEDAVRHAGEVKGRGYAASFNKHAETVHDFWKKWWVMVPDENIAELYYKSMWIIAGCVGNYYPPNPTTIANPSYHGRWFGDYDIPYHVLIQTGHFDRVSKTEDFLFSALPKDREKGFHCTGADQCVHIYEDLSINNELANCDNAISAQQGWLPWMFYTHYRLTGDKTFLKEKAYPLMKASCIFIAATVSKTTEGYEYLGVKDGKAQSLYSVDERWICAQLSSTKKPVDNPADIMTAVKWTLQTTAVVADMLGIDKEKANRWREISSGLVIPQNDKHYIGCKGDDLDKREGVFVPAILMGVYPIPLIEDEKIERTYLIIKAKLHSAFQAWNKGMWQQVARMRLSGELDDLMYNSHWRWNSGLSIDKVQLCESAGEDRYPDHGSYYYLEIHAVVVGAVNEIMLQSHNGIIKIFPCLPTRWKDENVAFSGLLAEVGFRVSSKYEKGDIPQVEVESLAGSKCRLELPLNWNGILIKDNNNQQIPYKKEKVKTRIDGMEHMVDVIEFNTILGGKYILGNVNKKLTRMDA
ncbi:MAG: hypothetical protein L6437_12000 [Kiritimatiellae bacterium]|nr:hypothetical protein [Kiritimatiellia bacterium]